MRGGSEVEVVRFLIILFLGLYSPKEASTPYYTPICEMEELCWVESLRYLDRIKSHPNLSGLRMVLGYQNNSGHAWVEYKLIYSDMEVVIQYDPSCNRIVKITQIFKKNNKNSRN